MKRRIDPPPSKPAFKPGDRVRISALGVEWRIAPAGTTGTVEDCSLNALIKIDGKESSRYFAPDFWDLLTRS